GNIRNTERLSFEEQALYELQVTAFDCGQRESSHSVAVYISVKPVCKPGWQGQCVCVCVECTDFSCGITFFSNHFSSCTYTMDTFPKHLTQWPLQTHTSAYQLTFGAKCNTTTTPQSILP